MRVRGYFCNVVRYSGKIDALGRWCLGGSLVYTGAAASLAGRCGVWPNNLSLLRSYRKEDSCCLDTWSEWMSRLTPGEFWLQFPRVIGEGQLDDPTPPGWPIWRTTYLCTTSPLRILLKWPWISRCGDYWQQAELCADGACRIMMMMMMYAIQIHVSLTLLYSGCH